MFLFRPILYFNKPFTIPDFKTIAVSSADLDKYIGVYSSTQIPLKISVTKNNTTLYAQATGQGTFPLEATGNDTFVFSAAGATLQFDPAKQSLSLMQGGATILFIKTN